MTATPRVSKCLGDAVAQGRLTQDQADEALATVKDVMERHGLPETEAGIRAADEIALAAAEHRRRTALRIIRTDEALQAAASHPAGFSAGVAALFARDITGRAGYSSVEGRARAVRAELHARFADGMEAFRTTALGLKRDVLGLKDFVRELYGQTSGNGVAAAAAKGWQDATDFGLLRFNQAGGTIARRETWRLPQLWDHAKVRAAGPDAFATFMRDAATRGDLRMVDLETGKPLDAARRDAIIAQSYQRIATNGLSDMTPGQPGGAGSVATSRNHYRAFEWTTPDAWFRFNERFGSGDAGIYDILVGHLDGISRDVGMMEVLGPNPQHVARLLVDTARKEGAGPYVVHKLAAIWDHVSGRANSPVSESIAGFFRGIRSWLTAAQLGSAVLSSTTDFATVRQAAAWNGISAADVMSRYLSLLDPRNAADRKLAVRVGLIADGWAQRAAGAMRNQADIIGTDLAGRTADFVLRASGMSAHTQAAKWAFGMELLGHFADQAGRAFDALDAPTQRAFRTYGITPQDWDLIRSRGLWTEEGVSFIHPEQVVRGAPGQPAGDQAAQLAASRMLELVHTESGFAVVEPGALERALLLGRSQPGTLAGEFLRSTMQYKTFPISMMTRHVARGIEAIRGGDRGRYMAATVVSLTVMGAAAMQLKAVAQGRDPRDMTDPKFWGAAFFQGGGAGIFGDFLNAGLNRADRGFYMAAVGGPTAGLADDLARLTGGNIQGVAEGKDTHFGAELARFVQRNAPGTSIWYARLALDRLLWDRLHELADPDVSRRFRRIEQRALKEANQRFWWGPGDAAPERAPSLGAAVGIVP
jgi:hypothetical protein